MKNHKNTLIQISLVLLSFALLFAPSCKQIIGLGPQVDMTGPTVNVQTPVDMQVVTGADFIISGTVIDDSEVAELTIDIPDLALFWKHTKDGWFSKTGSASSWQPLTDGVAWDKDEKGLISWEVITALSTEHQHNSDQAEFIVTVSAKDNSNNSSSKSVQQRTIVYDNIIPGFTLNKPALKSDKKDIAGYELEDIAIISSLLNGDLNLQWNIKEDSKIHKLKIALYDVSKTEDEKEVFSEEFVATETKQILRSDSLTVAADKFSNEGKQIIEVRVRVVDAGGNVLGKEDATDELLSLGYFCYWPEADIPWLALPMEKHSEKQDEPNYNFPVSPKQEIRGHAYDDDGVKSVSVKIYKENLNEPVLEETIPKIPENENLGKTYQWSVSAPEEAGNYRIEVSCKDINNKESATAIDYFNVEDTGAPSITIDKIDGKSFEQSPLLDLMGADGKFTLSGKAEDDSGIKKVQIAWFKNLEDKPKYLNGEKEVWDLPNSANAKIWKLEPESGTKKFEFSQAINIFSDLGVGGSSLLFGNFNFVIRAEDISGKTKCISLTTNGDREPPLLTIDSLNLSGTTYYFPEKGKTVGAKEIPENGLPLNPGEKISFSGTWKDNSTTKWNDKNNIGEIELKCNEFSFTVTKNPDGTWTSKEKEVSISSFAYLSLSQKDWGGNTGTANASFIVQTDKAAFVRVSTDLADGAYTAGQIINLYLEFTKPVSSSDSPSLTLNFGTPNKTASYVSSSNNSKKHHFTYTVKAGDTVNKLNIKSLSGTWKEGSETVLTSRNFPTNQNLGDFHAIEIDTSSPTLEKFTTTNTSASYSTGRQINIQAYFSEPVMVTGTPRLQLNTVDKAFAVYQNASDNGKILNFSYTVGEGKNTPAGGLKISSFDFGSSPVATVKDFAGNAFTSTAGGDLDKNIIIDTTAPDKPEVQYTDGTALTSFTSFGDFTFQIAFAEEEGKKEYSVDGGTSWKTYTEAVSLSNSGPYTISARHTDIAGNVANSENSPTVTIDKNPIFLNLSHNKTPGTYGTDTEIEIFLHFKTAITVTGTPSFSLNNGKTANFVDNSNESDTLIFTYKIGDESTEAIENLAWEAFNLDEVSFEADFSGNKVPFTFSLDSSTHSIENYAQIAIVVGKPSLKAGTPLSLDVDDNRQTLSIEFDREVSLGEGFITIKNTQYRLPSVLTEERYTYLLENLSEETDKTAFKEAYGSSPTTNGLTAEGKPDLSPKYVLAFDIDNTDRDLIPLLKKAGDHEVKINVQSPDIEIDSTNAKKVKVTLEDSNLLQVKGVSYSVQIDEKFVRDSLNNEYAGTGETNLPTIALSGIEKPSILLEKKKETLSGFGSTIAATQPNSARFKIACRTPDVTLKYGLSELSFAARSVVMDTNGDQNMTTGDITADYNAVKADPPTTSATKSYTEAVTITPSDNQQGYKCRIIAEASKDGVSETTTTEELAYRTVLIFKNTNLDSFDGQIWVRGGDAPDGTTSTPGFPLSWSVSDYSGIHLLTYDTDKDQYYWSTWDISTTGYCMILRGTNTDNDDGALGPNSWWWSVNAWVGYLNYYRLYPGAARILYTDPTKPDGGNGGENFRIDGLTRGNFNFQDTGGSR